MSQSPNSMPCKKRSRRSSPGALICCFFLLVEHFNFSFWVRLPYPGKVGRPKPFLAPTYANRLCQVIMPSTGTGIPEWRMSVSVEAAEEARVGVAQPSDNRLTTDRRLTQTEGCVNWALPRLTCALARLACPVTRPLRVHPEKHLTLQRLKGA